MEKVSIVIPIFNTPELYFRKCIESILSQSYQTFEVILFDDGSSNGVELLCDEYANSDKRIRVIHNKNIGFSAARNKGTEFVSGTWLIYLDPDDWWEKNTLEVLCEKMKNDKLDLLFFSYFDEYENGQSRKRKFWKEKRQKYCLLTNEEIRNIRIGMLDESISVAPGCFGSACMQMISISFVRQNSISFKENIYKSEDLIYQLEILDKVGKVGALEYPLYHYRHHNISACNNYNPNIEIIAEEVNKELLVFCKEHDETFQNAMRFYMMKNYLNILRLNYFHSLNNKSWKEKRKSWKSFVNNGNTFFDLKQENWRKIYRWRKIWGIFFIVSFRLKSFVLLRFIYKFLYSNRERKKI